MEGKINYTAVGIFVVLLVSILFVLIFWLTAYTHTKKYASYLVFVHDDVTGLSIDSPVRFNGVQVGIVKSIRLDRNNAKLVRILLNIDPEVQITTSTYAVLNAQGITGLIYVNLKTTEERAPLLKAAPGEPYPVIPAEPSLFMQISNVMPKLARDLHTLSSSLAKILDQSNTRSITESLKNVETFTSTLSNNSHLVEDNLKLLNGTLLKINHASQNIPQLVESMQTLSDEMRDTSHNINLAAKNGNVLINNLISQILPTAHQTINEMGAASSSIHVFMQQLQQNPSILVRGQGKAIAGPGE